MAFPLDPTHLRAHLRALILSNKESENECAAEIIRPLELGLFHKKLNNMYFPDFRPVLPPIPYDISEKTPTLKASSRMSHKRVSSKAKRRARKERESQNFSHRADPVLPEIQPRLPTELLSEANDSNSLINTIPLDAVSPVDTVDKRQKEKQKEKRSSLSKLFTPSAILGALKQQDPKRNSIDTVPSSHLDALSGNHSNYEANSPEIETDEQLILGSLATAKNLASDEASIEIEASDDSTIEGAEDSMITRSNSYNTDISLGFSDSDSDSNSSSDSSSFERGSGSHRELNMMYNYSVPESYLLARNEDAFYKEGNTINDIRGDDKELQTSDAQLREKHATQDLHFEKVPTVNLAKQPNQSQLSSMINCRQEVINENPLSYFSFTSPESESEDGPQQSEVRKASIDVFVPPRSTPVLRKVSVVTSVRVFDCIGYFLSEVIKTDEFKDMKNDAEFIDPNNWRMELIDSDGDLYDSTFGVLDRSRLLSSYNSPKNLAICRVTNQTEVKRNEKVTPLPSEFKQNLELFQQRAADLSKSLTKQTFEKQSLGAIPDNSVEVQVKDVPNQKKEHIKLFVPSTMQVGALFDMICKQYELDQSNYKLVGVETTHMRENIFMSELISDIKSLEGHEVPLESTSKIEDLGMFNFKLVSASKQIVKLMLNIETGAESLVEAGITPDPSSYIQAGITPPRNRFLLDETDTSFNREERRGSHTKATGNGKSYRASALLFEVPNFDDQFKSRVPDIPTTINTVYFKWKVWRKKPPLINRIEKSLIIDGETIHIAPADNVSLKKQNDVLYGGSQSESKHHHHHLHHYNYNKYYNDTMMKISSFPVSLIVKLKHFKKSKYPLQFKIVVERKPEPGGKEGIIQKKYDLEAEDESQLKDIIKKIEWVRKSYDRSLANQNE